MATNAEQPNWDAVWEKACIAFEVAAGIDLKKVQAVPNADTIRAKLEAKKAKDAEDNRKITKIKDIFNQTLTCIDRVGGLAAQGASMVFGPATIASGALSFFIAAGVEYRHIFDAIDEILTKVIVLLERFQVYHDNLSKIPPQLTHIATKSLVEVVEICGLCCQIIKKERWKTWMKITFLGIDSGIQAKIGELQALEAEESSMRGALGIVAIGGMKESAEKGFAQTTKSLEDLNSGVQIIQTGVQGFENRINHSEELRYLRKALNVSQESNSTDGYQHYAEKISSETCSWLPEDPTYQSWFENSKRSKTLVVSGEEGTGKSFTVAVIVKDLNQQYEQLKKVGSRISLAYCFIPKVGKGEKKFRLSAVIRGLAWQISQGDDLYRNGLVDKCERNLHNGNALDIWEKIMMGCFMGNGVYFLVVDGIQNLDIDDQQTLVEITQRLVTSSQQMDVRLLLGARTAFTQKVRSRLPVLAVLDLTVKNKDDISRHVRAEIDNMGIFGKGNEIETEVKKSISEVVLKAVKGDFVYAGILLREIEKAYDIPEIHVIIQRIKAGGKMSDPTRIIVDRYNRTLSAKELEDLKTILRWTLFSESSLEIVVLEGVILLSRGKLPLQPIFKLITERFSELFTVEIQPNFPAEARERFATVSIKSDMIIEHFKDVSGDSHSNDVKEGPTKREIRMLRNFIEKFCDEELYKQLEIHEFFEQKMSETASTLFVNCESANALITRDCLNAMLDGRRQLHALRGYAATSILQHFQKLDTKGIYLKVEAEIGSLLVRTLYDPLEVSQALKLGYNLNGRHGYYGWIYGDDMTKELVRLLRSPNIMMEVMTTGDHNLIDWIESIRESSSPEIDVFAPAAKVVARNLLMAQGPFESICAFKWFYGFINRVQYNNNPSHRVRIKEFYDDWDIPFYADPDQMTKISMKEIHETFDLAQKYFEGGIFDPKTSDSLATIYTACKYESEALEIFKVLSSIKVDDLEVIAKLADIYASRAAALGEDSNYMEAIRYESQLLQAAERKASQENLPRSIDEIIENLVKWNLALGKYDEAKRLCSQQLAEDPGSYRWIGGVILALCGQKQITELIDIVDKLRASDRDDSSHKRHSSLFLNLAHDPDDGLVEEPLDMVFRAFYEAGKLSCFKQYCEEALSGAVIPDDKLRYFFLISYEKLKFRLALTFYRHPESLEEKKRAMVLWEDLVLRCEVDDPGWMVIESLRILCSIYLQQAHDMSHDISEGNKIIQKIEIMEGKAGDPGSDPNLTKSIVRSLLSRCCSALNKTEEVKRAIKANIKGGMALLFDAYTDNDWIGFREIGTAFMDYGDDKNAVAAWGMIGPNEGLEPYDEMNGTTDLVRVSPTDLTESSTTERTFREDATDPRESHETQTIFSPSILAEAKLGLRGPLRYVNCGGPCGRRWTFADDILICRRCINFYLCPSCHKDLPAGELNEGWCNPDHSFLHIPPWKPENIARIKNNMVEVVGGKHEPLSQWLADIKREWMIDDEEEGGKSDKQ